MGENGQTFREVWMSLKFKQLKVLITVALLLVEKQTQYVQVLPIVNQHQHQPTTGIKAYM